MPVFGQPLYSLTATRSRYSGDFVLPPAATRAERRVYGANLPRPSGVLRLRDARSRNPVGLRSDTLRGRTDYVSRGRGGGGKLCAVGAGRKRTTGGGGRRFTPLLTQTVATVPIALEVPPACARAHARVEYNANCGLPRPTTPVSWIEFPATARCRTSRHPLPRPAAHVGHTLAGRWCASQGRPGAPRPFTDRHHTRHVLPRRADHAARGRQQARRDHAGPAKTCEVPASSVARSWTEGGLSEPVVSVGLKASMRRTDARKARCGSLRRSKREGRGGQDSELVFQSAVPPRWLSSDNSRDYIWSSLPMRLKPSQAGTVAGGL